jgi:beta-hydroxylase
MIRAKLEQIIARYTRNGQTRFFDTTQFPWVSELEAAWPQMRAELDEVLEQRERIPNFQDISEDQRVLTEGDQWKTLFLFGYGHEVKANCARCPVITRHVRKIPGMLTAMISILAPGKHIPPHRGPYKGVLRFHLGLLIPGPPGACRIRIDTETRPWVEGRSLIFDDSFEHEAWNDTGSLRAVLFVDFVRPLPFPLSLLNRVMLFRISRSPFIVEARDKAIERAL